MCTERRESYSTIGNRANTFDTKLITKIERNRPQKGTEDYFIVSHIHINHAGGAGTLIRHSPNAKLVVHPKGALHLIDSEYQWNQSKLVLKETASINREIEQVPEDRIITAS